MFLKILKKLAAIYLSQSLLFNKVAGKDLQIYQEETPAQSFS